MASTLIDKTLDKRVAEALNKTIAFESKGFLEIEEAIEIVNSML